MRGTHFLISSSSYSHYYRSQHANYLSPHRRWNLYCYSVCFSVLWAIKSDSNDNSIAGQDHTSYVDIFKGRKHANIVSAIYNGTSMQTGYLIQVEMVFIILQVKLGHYVSPIGIAKSIVHVATII